MSNGQFKVNPFLASSRMTAVRMTSFAIGIIITDDHPITDKLMISTNVYNL